MGAPDAERSAAREARWPLALLCLAQLAGIFRYFPPSEAFSGQPLLTSDYVLHYFGAVRVASYIRAGSFLGYCTTWSAGFPDGFVTMVNGKPFALVLALVPDAVHPLAFNLTVLAFLWAFAPLVHVAARAFGASRREAAVATALALCAWYGSGLFRIFWRGGSVMFVTGAAAAMAAVGFLFEVWSGSERPPVWKAAAAVALVPWIHPGAAVIVILGGAAAYLWTFRTRGPRAYDLLVVSATTLAINAPWLVPFVRDRDLRRTLSYPVFLVGIDQLANDLLWAPLHVGSLPRVECAIAFPLLIGAVLATALRGEIDLRARVLGSLACLLTLLAYLGAHVDALATLQPYRFAMPATLALAMLAAPAARALAARPFGGRHGLLLVLVLLLVDRMHFATRFGDYLATGLGPTDRWALEALRKVASPSGAPIDGRVLLEGDWISEPVPGRRSLRRVSYAFVGFEGALDAELIGAPIMAATTWSEPISFWRGKLAERDFAGYDRSSFLAFCERYDVGWVVSLHDGTRRKLESFAPEVERLDARGGVAIFRVHRQSSRIARGSGVVGRDAHHVLWTASTVEPAVLRYHWNRLLAAAPAAELGPAPEPDVSGPAFLEIRPAAPGRHAIGASP